MLSARERGDLGQVLVAMEMVLAQKQNDAKSRPEGPLGNGRGVAPPHSLPGSGGFPEGQAGLQEPADGAPEGCGGVDAERESGILEIQGKWSNA